MTGWAAGGACTGAPRVNPARSCKRSRCSPSTAFSSARRRARNSSRSSLMSGSFRWLRKDRQVSLGRLLLDAEAAGAQVEVQPEGGSVLPLEIDVVLEDGARFLDEEFEVFAVPLLEGLQHRKSRRVARQFHAATLTDAGYLAPPWRTRSMQPSRHPDRFVDRHIGPREEDVKEMLAAIGLTSLDELIDRTVPRDIRLGRSLDLPPG